MINGSFAAFIDNKEITKDFARRVSEDLGKGSGTNQHIFSLSPMNKIKTFQFKRKVSYNFFKI